MKSVIVSSCLLVLLVLSIAPAFLLSSSSDAQAHNVEAATPSSCNTYCVTVSTQGPSSSVTGLYIELENTHGHDLETRLFPRHIHHPEGRHLLRLREQLQTRPVPDVGLSSDE